MKFIDLHIKGFGKFHDLTVQFSEGLNVVYGHNEAGKSTLHSFIRAMLYGITKKPGVARLDDMYRRYEPWDSPKSFGGELRFSYRRKKYLLKRVFYHENKSISIYNETDQSMVVDPEDFLREVLSGISENAYCNTVSIGQLKSGMGKEMAKELRSYIENVRTTGDAGLNSEKAVAILREKKISLENQIAPEAARSYAALMAEIKELEREVADPAYENRLQEFTDLQNVAQETLKAQNERRDALLKRTAEASARLNSTGFSEEAQIISLEDMADYEYARYQKALAERKSVLRRAAPIACPLAGVVSLVFCLAAAGPVVPALGGVPAIRALSQSLGFEAMSAMPGMPAALPAVVFAFLSLVLFSCGFINMAENGRAAREFRQSEENLEEILERHLGARKINEESMQELRKQLQEFRSVCLGLEKDRKDLELLEETSKELTEEEKQYDKEVGRQKELEAMLEGKLLRLSEAKMRAEDLEKTLVENERLAQEADAVSLAIETITGLSTNLKDRFGYYLNKQAASMMKGVTNGAYKSLWIDDQLHIYLIRGRKRVPLETASSGTVDQVNLALRLSASRFLQDRAKEYLPLIFDDSFAMYDDSRLRAALVFIQEQYPEQILLFTCHQREERALSDIGAVFRLISLG